MPNWKKLIVSGSDANLNSLDTTANITIGGLLKVADGSNSAPSITFTDDTDTGIYRSADNAFNITVGGVNKFTVNSTGITSGGNVYSGNSSEFRNYGGTWKATTGLTGNGFQFINSVDGTALTLDSTGSATFGAGVIIDQNGSHGRIRAGGSMFLGGSGTTLVQLSSKLIPDSDSSHDLGQSNRYWKDAYIDTITTTGAVNVGGDLTIPGYILHAGNTGTAIGFDADNVIRLKTNSSTAFQIDSSQNIKVVAGSLSISGDNANYVTLTESGTGDFTIDAPDDIRLDAGGGDIVLRDDGVEYGRLSNNAGGNLKIRNITQDKDIIFEGNYNGATINALRLDMSDAGWAHFNAGAAIASSVTIGNDLTVSGGDITLGTDSIASNINAVGDVLAFKVDSNENTGGTPNIQFKVGADTELTLNGSSATFGGDVNLSTGKSIYVSGANGLRLLHDGTDGHVISSTGDLKINNSAQDKDIIFRGNDNGSSFTALTLDMSEGGNATFASNVTVTSNLTANLLYTDFIQTRNGQKIDFRHQDASVIMTVDTDDARVGIGTTSPLAPLDVNGNIYSSGNLLVNKIFSRGGSADLQLDTRAGYGVNVTSGSTSIAYFDHDTARVGIGTTSPATKLDVNAGTENLVANFTSTDSIAEIRVKDSSKYTRLLTVGTQFKIMPNDGSETLILDGNGNTATFAGTVSAEDNIYLTDAGTVRAKLLLNASDRDNVELRAESLGSTMKFFTVGTEALELDASQNATFAGDVTVAGTLTAQQFHTEIVSASILFDSGSTKFGDTADDKHSFTGSLETTGSILARSVGTKISKVIGASDSSLEVENGLSIFRGTSSVGWLVNSTSSNHFGIYNWNRNGFVFRIEDNTPANALYIKNSGNVGIGAGTSPADKLEVAGLTNYTGLTLKGTGASRPALTFKNVNQSLLGSIYGTEGRAITFEAGGDGTTGVVAMTISNTGAVGIGTTSPTSQLEVYGGSSGTNDVDRYVRFKASNGEKRFDFYIGGTGNASSLSMYSSDGTTKGVQIASAGTTYFNGGNVGIGTTSPDSKLEVITSGVNSVVELDNSDTNYTVTQYNAQGATKGFSGFNSSFMVFGGESGTDTRLTAGGQYALTIKNDTRDIGIGTTSPTARLDVRLSGTTGKVAEFHNSVGYGIGLTLQSDGGVNTINAESNQALAFATNGASNERMRITSAGNVGIGATSPQSKLHLSGSSANASGIRQSRDGVKIWTQEIDSNGKLQWSYRATEGGSATQHLTLNDTGQAILHSYGSGNHTGTLARSLGVDSSGNIIEFTGGSGGGTVSSITNGADNRVAVFNGTDSLDGDSGFTFDGTKLTVEDTIAIQRNGVTAGTSTLQQTGTGLIINAPSGYHPLVLQHNTTELLRLRNDGKLGVGIASPSTKFQVKSGGADDGIYLVKSDNSNLLGGVIQTGSGDGALVLRNTSNSQVVLLRGNGNNYINGGNLGIGTTSPDTSLELFKEQDGDYLGLKISKLHSNGYEYTTEYGNNQLKFSGNQNYNFYNDSNKVADFHNAHTKFYGNGGVLKMNISGSGEVVIGALSSGATGQLVVNQEGGVAPVAKFMTRTNKAIVQVSDNDTTGYLSSENGLLSLGRHAGVNAANININASHNVGMGTSSPTTKLDVRGSMIVAGDTPPSAYGATLEVYRSGSNSELLIHQDDASSFTKYAQLHFRNGGNDTYIKTPTSGQALIIDTESVTNAIGIRTDGRVGIGTITPSDALQIKGDGKGFYISSADYNVARIIPRGTGASLDKGLLSLLDAGVEDIRIDAGGHSWINTGYNLGIGTGTPAYTLDVNGDIQNNGVLRRGGNVYIKSTGSDTAIGPGGAGTITFHTSSVLTGAAEAMRIDANGNVLINNTSAGARLDIREDSNYAIRAEDASGHYFRVNTGGNTEIRGNLTVGGVVTAQEFHTEFVSASIVYESGSTKFGDTQDDDHDFTGSLNVSGSVHLSDSSTLKLGNASGGDLQLYHNGSHSLISNQTGNLYIRNQSNDGKVYFQADDGNGNDTNYFYLDGTRSDGTNFATRFPDQSIILLGSGTGWNDGSQIYHNGTNFYLNEYAGNVNFTVHTDDGDITFSTDDGSGGVTQYFRIDGGASLNVFSKDIFLADNKKALFGSNSDLKIYHDGTDSIIQNYVGSIYIDNNADNQDIVFRCDDGSGGLTQYFRLDGSEADGTYTYTSWGDGDVITLGGSKDLRVWHDPSTNSSYIRNYTNHLFIENSQDDGDIIFKSDDGSGGVAEYFRLDGGLGYSVASQHIQMIDGKAVYYGSGNDLGIYHSSNNSYIENITGNLIIQNHTDDGDIIFKSDDGSGGIEEYFALDGGLGANMFYKRIKLTDNVQAQFGNNPDLLIYHDGNHSIIKADGTGNLILRQDTADADIVFKSDDGSGGSAEYFKLDGTNTRILVSKPLNLKDNVVLQLGDSQDLRIYHNGSNSYIQDAGVGSLKILAQDFDLTNAAESALMIRAIDGAQVELYYGGAKKLQTTSGGVTVTGDLDADDVTIDGWGSVSASLSSIQTAGGVNGSGQADRVAIWSDADTVTFDSGFQYHSDSLKLFDADYVAVEIRSDVAEHSSILFKSGSDSSGRIGWHKQGYFAASAMSVNPNNAMFIDSPNGFDFAHNSTGSLSIKSGSADVIIDSKVNLGIGVAAPAYKLDVTGDSTSGVIAVRNSANGRDTFRSENAAGTRTVNIGNDGNGHGLVLVRGSGGTTTNYIAGNGNSYFNAGNVGIGTTSPTYKLEVHGSTAGSHRLRVVNASTGQSSVDLKTSQQETRLIAVNNKPFYVYDQSASAELFTITTGGNVGIGDASPTNLSANTFSLSVNSSRNDLTGALVSKANGTVKHQQYWDSGGYAFILTASSGDFKWNFGSSEKMRLTETGRVGIGTISPTHNLHVAGTTSHTTAKVSTTTANANFAVTTNNSDFALIGQGSSNRFDIWDSNAGATRLSVDSAGDVGIGVTDPDAKLEVKGPTSDDQSYNLRLRSADDQELMYVRNDGIVKISHNYLYVDNSAGIYTNGQIRARAGVTDDGGTLGLGGNGQVDNLVLTSNTSATFSGNVTTLGGLTIGDSNADTAQIGLKHLLGYCENTDVDTGTEDIKSLPLATYQAVFFDYVVKNGTNLRAGTVTAVHDGTNVEFTDTSTKDLGDTSAVTLSVDISGSNMRLRATTTSDNWIVKANIRGIKV